MSADRDSEILSRRRTGGAIAMAALKGWPAMHGTEEERDREFQRMVIREAIRLGLAPRPGAIEPDKMPPEIRCTPDMAKIVLDVAARHQLKAAYICGPSRSKKASRARADAMRALHATGPWSLPQIARAVGLTNHTSVIHVLRSERAA